MGTVLPHCRMVTSRLRLRAPPSLGAWPKVGRRGRYRSGKDDFWPKKVIYLAKSRTSYLITSVELRWTGAATNMWNDIRNFTQSKHHFWLLSLKYALIFLKILCFASKMLEENFFAEIRELRSHTVSYHKSENSRLNVCRSSLKRKKEHLRSLRKNYPELCGIGVLR